MPRSVPPNSTPRAMGEPGTTRGDLGEHDGLLLDLDGTAYRGSEVIAGVPESVERLRAQGVPVRFVTNNAARSAAEVVAGLRRAGFTAAENEVHTSSDAAATVLSDALPEGSRVLVLGTEGLAHQVRAVGLEPLRTADGEVAAVVQGHSRHTGWRELAEACIAIRAGAWWVACNRDVTLPSERGELPGNGAMVEALRVATGLDPVVAGKPSEPLLMLAGRAAGCDDPLVVGDRLETDIAGAHAARMDALLVLSGVSTPERLLAAVPDERPRYVAVDVAALCAPVTELEVGSGLGAHYWRVEEAGSCLTVFSTGARCEGGDGGTPARPSSTAMTLLRTLCPVAWRTGVSTVRAGDEQARSVLAELGLVGTGQSGCG